VLAAREQALGMPGDTQHLLLDAVKHIWRKDDLVPADVRAVEEAEQRPRPWPEHFCAKGNDVPAEHVVLDGQITYLG